MNLAALLRVSAVRLATALVLVAAALPAGAVSTPSADVPPLAKRDAAPSLRMAPDADVARHVVLPAIDPQLILRAKSDNTHAWQKRLQIGVGRDVPRTPEASSAGVAWKRVPGGAAAHWIVSSPGAAAVRVSIEAAVLPAGSEFRFSTPYGAGVVYGPYAAGDVLDGAPRHWSPVLEGESALVELFIPEGFPASAARVALAEVSHLFVSPADPGAERRAKLGSQSCEVDLICKSASDPALARVGKSVARMTFLVGSDSYLCTGTLLNATDGQLKPYFFSANHCLSTQSAANTLTTHWFYDRTDCGSGTTSPDYRQLAGGATLLYADQPSDALLLQLNGPPPAGAVFAGWNADAIADASAALTAIHHPAGDWKKISVATMGGFLNGVPGGPSGGFIVANWDLSKGGVTEVGSSGSGLFTAVGSPAIDYQLRGGLFGGPSSCAATGASLQDYYSRFDQVYPAIRQYLDPTQIPPAADRLVNISTRGAVLTGDNVLIGGFVIAGVAPKSVLIRARGPSLRGFGVANAISDPQVTLVNQATLQVIAVNDNWGAAANADAITATGKAPTDAREAAILTTLVPGAYTAVVSGAGGSTGVGIVEIFEMDRPDVPLANISTRGYVLTGDGVMIGGFIVEGANAQSVLIRARGPSLVPLGVTNAILDPQVTLVNQATGAVVAVNDNWGSADNADAITATGKAPTDSREAAILVTLNPGAYTAVLSGVNATTGVGIIEIFGQ